MPENATWNNYIELLTERPILTWVWNSFFVTFVVVLTGVTLDLAINISFNPTRSIIADVTPDGNPRTRGYTWMQTISGFFGVAAYAVGATLGNYVLIYACAVIVLLFSILPPLFITEERVQEEAPEESDTDASAGHTRWGQLLRIYFAHAFSWLGIQTMFVYIIAYIQQKLAPGSDFETGQIISISFLILNTVGFILPVTVLEPLSERVGRARVHMTAVAVMALGYLGIVLIGKTVLALYVLMAVAGVGWAAVVSLPFAIMSENVAKGRMGFSWASSTSPSSSPSSSSVSASASSSKTPPTRTSSSSLPRCRSGFPRFCGYLSQNGNQIAMQKWNNGRKERSHRAAIFLSFLLSFSHIPPICHLQSISIAS